MSNLLDNNIGAYYLSEAEYLDAVNAGKIKKDEVVAIATPYRNTLACASIDGTVQNYYDFIFEFNEDGIQIENLDNIQGIYKAVYKSLLKNHPEKRDERDALLKINKYDYRLTVLQIENNNLMEVNKEKDVI